MEAPEDTVELDQARYRVVHEFRGGAAKLARLAGMNYGTLCNKVNPLVETHHLTVDEAVSLQYIARDYRIHEAEGRMLGRASIPIGEFPDCSDMELLDTWANWQVELGETAAKIRLALDEGRVTREHVREVRREIFEDLTAAMAVLDRLQGLVDER